MILIQNLQNLEILSGCYLDMSIITPATVINIQKNYPMQSMIIIYASLTVQLYLCLFCRMAVCGL